MVVVGRQVALVPADAFAEVMLGRIAEPGQEFEGTVDRGRADVPIPPARGACQLFDGDVGSRPEKELDDVLAALAALSAGGRDLGLNPAEEVFQRR
jgi:hypothetical protein